MEHNLLNHTPLFRPEDERDSTTKTSGSKSPFLDSFPDSPCKLNIKDRKSFMIEAPPTPGRPVFRFSTGNFPRKNAYPSKWDDAEKWLANGSYFTDSPANSNNGGVFLRPIYSSSRLLQKQQQCNEFNHNPQPNVTEEQSSATTADVVLKAITHKLTDEMKMTKSPKFGGCSEQLQKGLVFDNSLRKLINQETPDPEVVKSRDIGTEMTPLGSSTTTRCTTPFKSTSPARHNTPADRSGQLGLTGIDYSSSMFDVKLSLQECHFAKLNLGDQFDLVPSNWSTREEEEEDVAKSLRHCEVNEGSKSVSESRCCWWDEEEKSKSCLRYQREEARIQAWVNLQSAKADAQSRKLEVKIEKMRSNLEEKLMKKMADVYRKAEEWRATAQFQHSEQIRKVSKRVMMKRNNSLMHIPSQKSCTCFPCNNQNV